jgi:cytochrome c-type biogenesis protein CcmE
MKTYGKFAALVIVLVGTLAWLAIGGISEGGTYFKTIPELQEMGDGALGKRLRVGGDVLPGSIIRTGREVAFVIHQNDTQLRVVYDGTDPLPDTFRDRAEALAEGRMGEDGVFRANKIQAKCASKYEAKPDGGEKPVYQMPQPVKQAGVS